MNKSIIVLGIDPGINNTGYSIGVFDRNKDHLTIKEYGVFSASTLAKKEMKEDYKIYGTVIVHKIYDREMSKLIDTYHPDFVVSESAFFNPHTPNAFLSLSLCIHTIRNVLYRYKQILYTVAPKEAKLTVCGGTATKTAIQDSIHKLKDLTIKHSKVRACDKMVEHEADSIAVQYTFVKNNLRNILLSTNN